MTSDVSPLDAHEIRDVRLGHPALGDGRQERVHLDTAPPMAATAAIISGIEIWSADQEKSVRIPPLFCMAGGNANAMTD